jgi:hypothetical protein
MKKPSEKSRRARIAHAFECAKPYLWGGGRVQRGEKFEFICRCLDHAQDCGEISRASWIQAMHVVASRLGRTDTMETWLRNQGVLDAGGPSKALQDHRLAWLNLLIKEFQGPAK